MEHDKGSLRPIYTSAAAATVAMLIIIPLQIIVFAFFPMPDSTEAWFTLMTGKPLVGMFHADFFLMVNNALIVLIYLAFYHSLKKSGKGLLQIAIVLGLIGITSYIASNKTFELFSLAGEYEAALSGDEKLVLLAAGKAMLSGWQGTSFDVYYVLNGIALLIFSYVMLRDGTSGNTVYGKTTAIIGLVSGFLMSIPSTAGTVGLIFSLLSLIPWYVFAIRFCGVFLRLRKEA